MTLGEARRGGQYQQVENKRFEHKGKIPIAFCADKYPYTRKGVIGMRQRTDAKQLRGLSTHIYFIIWITGPQSTNPKYLNDTNNARY